MNWMRCACAAVGTLAAAGVADVTNMPVVVEPAKEYNAWPMIQAVKGRLVCVFTAGKRHDPGERGRGTYARTSSDGGRTWSERHVVSVDARCGESPVGKGLDENGAGLFWVRRFGPKTLMGLYRTEDGEHFELIAEPKFKGPMMQITDVMHIPGKGMVCFWFGGSYGNDMKMRHWGVIESTDNGRTWKQRVLGEKMAKEDWPTEQSGVYLGDGRILAIARTEVGGKSQFQLTSTDYGETWTVRKTNIFDVGASTPSLIYDPNTGLVSNYYYHRGPGILRCRRAKAYEVFDHPESWPAAEVLVADGGYSIDSGNANATVLDGKHIVAYYTGRAPDTAVMALPVAHCERKDWGVPNGYHRDWEPLADSTLKVTLGDLGKDRDTSRNHQQGLCCNDRHIFAATSDALIKLDWNGRPIIVKKVRAHMGDLAWHDGLVYAAWARAKEGGPKAGRTCNVAVFDEEFNLVREVEVKDIDGIDGITVLGDTIYFGVNDGGRTFHRRNRIGRMTLDLKLVDYTWVDIGVDVNYGVQNLATDGNLVYGFFYTHLGPRPGSPICCGVFDRNLKLIETKQAYSGQGIDRAPERFQKVPGKTVFIRGGSSFHKADSPDSFVRFRYDLRTLK